MADIHGSAGDHVKDSLSSDRRPESQRLGSERTVRSVLLVVFWVTAVTCITFALVTGIYAGLTFPIVVSLAMGWGIFAREMRAGGTDDVKASYQELLRNLRIRPFAVAASVVAGWLLFSIPAVPFAVALHGWVQIALELVVWLRHQSVLITVLGTALLGLMFFLFRLKLRVVYGVTEAFAGLSVAWFQASIHAQVGLPTKTEFYLVLLTAGIYLVVRGLDNIHTGIEAGGDPLFNWLIHKQIRRS